MAEDGIAHRFFANLLPEGGVRDRIVRDLKISNTDFNLLRAIGGECAGALSILPVERFPSTERNYRPIPDTELADLVARRGQVYATWPVDERPRLSLAGAQDKCPMLVRDGGYFLPQREAPSSHILKFELADYRHLLAYETFTTHLAGSIGLPVVDIELCTIEKRHYALIVRYDRVQNAQGEVQRLHQEDFFQALGYGHDKKYQDSGGPSFAQCYRMPAAIPPSIHNTCCAGRYSMCWRETRMAMPRIFPCCIWPMGRLAWPPSMTWSVRARLNVLITISPSMSAVNATPE